MRSILAALALAASGLMAAAQVNVELVLDQEQFLRNESLPVRLRLSNFSGQDLRLGEQPDWLVFSIETRDGKALSQSGQLALPKPFTAPSAKTVSLRVDLMPYFNIGDPGLYTVTARVKIPEVQKQFSTESRPFEIITGTRLWERQFGLPGHTPPELRKYALQQADFLKQMRLYIRVTDPSESKVFNVSSLGPIVSFSSSTVETQLDRSSNLHLLFQAGRNSFSYFVIEPDGEQIIRQTYEQAATRPHLKVEEDGRILVSGGARKFLLSDFPPARVANTNERSAGSN